MSEFSILEGLMELSSKLDIANETNIQMKAELLNTSGFIRSIEHIGIPVDSFTLEGETGKVKLLNNTKIVDIEASLRHMSDGKLIEALKDLKVSKDVTDLASIQKYAENYKILWDKQHGVMDIVDQKATAMSGQKVFNEVNSDPTTVENAQIAVNSNEALRVEFDSKLNDLNKKIKDAKNSGKGKISVGKWVKRTIVTSGGIITLAVLYSEIIKHRSDMNGCWLVNIRTGGKCKVELMTCNADDRKKHICNDYKVCGKNSTESCLGEKACVEKNTDKSCKKYLTQCTAGKCSKLCDSSKIQTPPGMKLVCVDVNFWGAAGDLLGTTLSDVLETLFGNNFIWYMFIVAAILILIILLK